MHSLLKENSEKSTNLAVSNIDPSGWYSRERRWPDAS